MISNSDCIFVETFFGTTLFQCRALLTRYVYILKTVIAYELLILDLFNKNVGIEI